MSGIGELIPFSESGTFSSLFILSYLIKSFSTYLFVCIFIFFPSGISFSQMLECSSIAVSLLSCFYICLCHYSIVLFYIFHFYFQFVCQLISKHIQDVSDLFCALIVLLPQSSVLVSYIYKTFVNPSANIFNFAYTRFSIP